MSVLKDNLVEQIEAVEAPLKERWHRLQAAYRFWNRATHHVLGFTVKLVLLLYFAFTLLFLALRWVVLPHIDHYKPEIEQLASRAVGQPVTIDRIYASWKGLRPQLILGDVVMRDAQGQAALHLPTVSATLSWWSVPAGGLRFESLEFHRPQVDVRREADGRLFAAGIYLDLDKKGDGKSADWLLSQREVVVRDGRITWTDLQRGSPPLQFDNVTALMLNQWRRHQFAFKATPPAALAAPIDVRADFSHQPFTRVADVKQWKGEVYAELRQADLAAWKPYLPRTIEVKSASGGVRAWLALDHAHPTAVTADVALDNVVAILGRDLPQLDVAALRGRVAASEQQSATLVVVPGAPPAVTRALALTDVSLRTRDGVELAPTTASARRVTAANEAAWTEVKAAALDLKILSELATRLPLPPAQRDLLAEAAPRGRVRNLVAEWRGPLPAPTDYKLKADLDGLGMEPLAARPAVARSAKALPMPALPNIPGFENLSGHVEAGEQGGSVALDAPGFTLAMPAWFDDAPMGFEQFKLNGSWSLAEARQLAVKLEQLDLVQDGMQLKLAGSHVLPRGPGAKGLGVSDFSGSIDGFSINHIGRYLPKQTPEHTRRWLVGALEEGSLHETTLRLRGELAHFPFKEGSPDKAKGEFRVAGHILDGRLNYVPGYVAKDGKSPVWPLAEKIRGSIVFDRARMEIKADTALTQGIALSNVKAVLPDLSSHDSVLEIDGNAAGPMQEFLKYVSASPVLDWIGRFTEETTGSGNARLALNLQLPLAHIIDAKVQGALQLQGNDVVLWHDMPTVAGATGKIEFNEKGVNLNNLAGTLLGGPLSVTGGSQKEGGIVVRLGGTATVDGLRKQYPFSATQRLANHLGGSAKFTGLVTVRDHKYEVAIDSAMQGASLDFPAPLKKAAADALPLHFQLNGGGANEQGVARDEIRVTLGNAYAARYHRQRVAKGGWKLLNGGIGVNLPAPEPDSGMMINASLKSLNVDDWIELATEIAGSESKPPAAAGAGEGSDIAQYVVPDTMAARTAELVVGERKLDNVVVGTTRSNGVWQASIDSQQAVGYVTWNESASGKGVGKVTARLSSLIIPESQAAAVKDLLEGSSNAPTIPALDIEVQQLEWFNRPLGQLELHAYNALVTSAREWRISKLSLINADGEFNATGRWQTREGQHNTALNFNMDIHNAGKLLERLGFADTLRNGKGKLSGDIAWKGLPYHLDLPSLSGTVAMNVEKGQFLKQDPGAAKLLGVLSLQALPRLLKLDFADVFSEGLQFDGITANATINHGIVKTDNLKMHGVQATVLMDGTADIANESTNLRVVVIPQVNLGTAPLVYALAVNPVIGLGSYLAQLFLSAPVMKALTYQMQVTGPWKAPSITKIENAKEPAP
ncbi:YhdP family protein [Pseudoduganella violaceinigra]|uniref:YhdP family protein n=1 Tax=Pseudoduganella violaceinigra TaxID=246602 RepID=UPI0003FC7084|nr:YhdP family protein [Pseudoduganella violaceinigra]